MFPSDRVTSFHVRRGGQVAVLAAVFAAVAACEQPATDAQTRSPRGGGQFNGFDVSNATIPTESILSGGPPRDGIPAILEPKFLPVESVDYLKADDKVISVTANGATRAYPLRILVWHEIVNDSIGDTHFAATYCPLCGTSMVFNREVDGKLLSFGVSGLLYQSDVLMYDHQTESLWSQLKMEAVSGPMVGKSLEWMPSDLMTWAAWREKYPEGKVLSTDTGHRRRYSGEAYEQYMRSDSIMFPVRQTRDELPNKEWVVGVLVNGTAKAYPVSFLESLGSKTFTETVGGTELEISYDRDAEWAQIRDADTGEALPHVRAYWFAWQAFYPETLLHEE